LVLTFANVAGDFSSLAFITDPLLLLKLLKSIVIALNKVIITRDRGAQSRISRIGISMINLVTYRCSLPSTSLITTNWSSWL